MYNNYLTDINFDVGIYIRLSQEDRDKDKKYESDSESVTNQRRVINEIMLKVIRLYIWLDEYVDDGFSGTDFERPGFTKD